MCRPGCRGHTPGLRLNGSPKDGLFQLPAFRGAAYEAALFSLRKGHVWGSIVTADRSSSQGMGLLVDRIVWVPATGDEGFHPREPLVRAPDRAPVNGDDPIEDFPLAVTSFE